MRERNRLLPYILLTAVLCGIIQLFLPWWTLTLAAALVAILQKSPQKSAIFWGGFWGVALLWLAYIGFIELQSRAILSSKLANLLHLPPYPPVAWFIAALIGGISGGLGALSGYYLKRIFVKEKKGYFY